MSVPQQWSASGKEVVTRTLAEYAAEATGDQGVRCPKCGCQRIGVSWRRNLGDSWLRVRECENCGQRIETSEKVERLLPPARTFDKSNQNGCDIREAT